MVSTVVIAAAFASTGLISLAPNLLLFLFPQVSTAGDDALSSSSSSLDWLSIGQALAAGGLLGDVFLHVIPHAAMASVDGKDPPLVGLWILLGFSIFLITDMIVRSTTTGHGHGHGHEHHHHRMDNKERSTHDNEQQHDHQHSTSTVLLNLAADALHNFTDGLAIGASFAHAHVSSSVSTAASTKFFWKDFCTLLQSRGGLATLSILFHEIPHELGDYATLIKEGFTQRSAIFAQFMTAVAALIGTGVGLVAHDYAGDRLIFVTAGGFVYLAAVTILPDVIDETASTKNRPNPWKFRLAILVAFAAGVGFLYVVSLLEELDESGHGHSHSHHSHGHTHHSQHQHLDDHDHVYHHDRHHDHHDHIHAEHRHQHHNDNTEL